MTPRTRARPAVPGGLGRRHRPWFEISLFMIGGGLFAALLWTIGTAPIMEALARLGSALGLVVGVEFLAILANTLSWRYTIAREWRGDVPFGRLVAARIVGDALNYVVPAGAGEISKVRLLSLYITAEPALASVALAKLTEGLALGLFGFLGLVVVWPIVATNPVGTVPIVLAALAGAGLAAGCFIAVRCGLVGAAVRVFQHLRAGRPGDPRLSVAATSADGA